MTINKVNGGPSMPGIRIRRNLRRLSSARILAAMVEGETRIATGDEPILGPDDFGAPFAAQMQIAIDRWYAHRDSANRTLMKDTGRENLDFGALRVEDLQGISVGGPYSNYDVAPGEGPGDAEGGVKEASAVVRPVLWHIRSSYMEVRDATFSERRLAAKSPHSDHVEESARSGLETSAPNGAGSPAEVCRLVSDAGAIAFYLSGADILTRFEGTPQAVDLGSGPLILEPTAEYPGFYRVTNLSLDELDAALDVLRGADREAR